MRPTLVTLPAWIGGMCHELTCCVAVRHAHLSTAGARAGMTKDTRSGLWESMFRGVQELRPHLVV